MRIKALLTLGVGIGATLVCYRSTAQQYGAPVEVGGNYNFVRSNAPPSGCGCFNLQGGGGVVLWHVSPRMEPLFKVSTTSSGTINGSSSNLKLTSYLFGARSGFHLNRILMPYGEAAVGVTHATGTVVTQGFGGGKAVVGATLGGGLLLDITPRLAIQAAQVDWYVTQVPNGVNNRQNNLLVSTGVLLRFGRTGMR